MVDSVILGLPSIVTPSAIIAEVGAWIYIRFITERLWWIETQKWEIGKDILSQHHLCQPFDEVD
jgi:hypothetical protein